jgi:hypothetical protein
MSLVAAVPAAFLAFLLVMAFLNHADGMGGTLNAVVGVALLAAVATALMPVGILLFGGPKAPAKPKAAKAPKPSKKKGKDEPAEEEEDAAAVAPDEAEEEVLVEEEEVVAAESDAMLDEFEADEDAGFEDDWDETGEGASDEFEFDDALSDDELDFDFDDENK